MLKEWLSDLLGRGGNDDVQRKLKPYLHDNNACVILRLVLENPGITPDQLVQRSGIHRTALEGYLNGMVLNGLAITEKEGTRTGYHISRSAKAAVVEHLPLNYQCPGLMRE